MIADSITVGALLTVIDRPELELIKVAKEFGHQLSRLFTASGAYAHLLSKSIDLYHFRVGMFDSLEPVRNEARKRPEETLRLMEIVQEKYDENGRVSGVILSWVIDSDSAARAYAKTNVLSQDRRIQKCCLVAINHLMISGNETEKRSFSMIVMNEANEFHEENFPDLLWLLILLRNNLELDTDHQIIQLIDKGGLVVIRYYLHFIRFQSIRSITVLESCLQVLSKSEPRTQDLARCIGLIYGLAPSKAIEIIDTLPDKLMLDIIDHEEFLFLAKKNGIEDIISFVETKIDDGKLRYVEEYVLRNVLHSDVRIIEWCEKHADDDRKKSAVVDLLRSLLTTKINEQSFSDEIAARCTRLSVYIAKKNGKDLDIARHIRYPNKLKEICVRCLFVLNKVKEPEISIDLSVLDENIKKYPCIARSFDESWIVQNASADDPHYITKILSQNSESAKRILSYWDGIFDTLERKRIRMDREKLRNNDRERGALAEAEIIARLSIEFQLEYQPTVQDLLPKKLDALVRFGTEEALVEITSTTQRTEVEEAHGVFSVPGGKVKNSLLDKFRSQLLEGKKDPRKPVIIVLHLEGMMLDHYEVVNSIYGEYSTTLLIEKNGGAIVEEGASRRPNGFYEVPRTEIVNAIAVYERHLDSHDPVIGKIYRCPRTTMNEISTEFLTRIRDALYGDGYIESYESLTAVEGVDTDTARFLFSRGIETIPDLVRDCEDAVLISKYGKEKLESIRREASRILNAKIRQSIRYLKGIDKDTYDLLISKRIFLIRDLLGHKNELDMVPLDILAKLVADAEYIQKIGI